MSLNWEDERYVRWYTRDTPEWCSLSWQARGLFGLIMRAVDRAGVLELGRVGRKGVAVAVRATWAEIEPYLSELTDDGCVVIDDATSRLILPNFMIAQEARQSDKLRAKESRERRKIGGASRSVTVSSRSVTESSHDDQNGHTPSQRVTPSHAVPSLAVPSQAMLSHPEEKKKKKHLSGASPDVQLVFHTWREMYSPGAILDKKRIAMISARIGEGHSVEKLIRAIKGLRRSRFHMGENQDGTKWTDAKIVLRSTEQVEKFAALQEAHERKHAVIAPAPNPTPTETPELTEARRKGLAALADAQAHAKRMAVPGSPGASS